jgi:REP element-mobilizing transposase RayT
MKLHRNSQKRIYCDDAVYFVTCKTSDNYPFFREQVFCDLFVENLRVCKKLKGFLLYAWVLAYDHFHLLLKPNDKFNLSDVMFSIKKQFSHNVNIVMDYNRSYTHPEGAQSIARLRNGDYEQHERLIVANDEKLTIFRNQFLQTHTNQNPHPTFQWQKSFHDHIIRNEKDFMYHYGYIENNSTKHKLPMKWSYVFTNSKYENLTDYIY